MQAIIRRQVIDTTPSTSLNDRGAEIVRPDLSVDAGRERGPRWRHFMANSSHAFADGAAQLRACSSIELLELARIAAHESGERINAPLLCYLVGLARCRSGRELPALVDATVGK